MGKAGRVACIFTPMALTIASLVCLVLLEVSGWGGAHGQLNSYYFMQANFTGLDLSDASRLDNTTDLSASLAYAHDHGLLAEIYEVHLWNYCSSNSSTTGGGIDFCSPRKADFYFNPISVWSLNSSSAAADAGSSSNPIVNEGDTLKNKTEALENAILGKSGREALDAYRHVAKWMFVAYEVSFWSTLATIFVGILAIFSRWGSFLTWITAFISSIFTLAATLTSTILFAALTGALKTLLDPYNIAVHLGTHAYALSWLATIFTWAATLFWLFSICCCSGRSNPHYKGNKGGLWNAEPKGQGYGGEADDQWASSGAGVGRGRGLRVEKTGSGYERVESPYIGAGGSAPASAPYGEHVALGQYPTSSSTAMYHQQTTGYTAHQPGYEPFRHS